MKRVTWVLAALLGLALSCGAPAQASWLFGPDKDEAKARLPGRTLQELISVLGYPESSVQVGSETVYVWRNVELVPSDVPVYDDPLLKNERLGTITTDERLLCTFKAVFRADGAFANYSIDGNNYACRKFYRQFLKLPEKPAAAAAPAAPSSPPAATPPTALVRPGEGPNRLVVLDDYVVVGPASWRQEDLDQRDGIVSVQFFGATASCLVVAVQKVHGTADEVWQNKLDHYSREGRIVAQDAFVENGIPVRIALAHQPGRSPTVFKVTPFPKATFAISTNGALDSPNALKRDDKAFSHCTVHALPVRP